jgi:2'-5' RNA ligase
MSGGMSGIHSIWLMPAGEDARRLSGLVDTLAARFGTPKFEPHLTLVEDMARAAAELAPLVDRVAAGVERFAAPIETVETSALFFRSVYMRFKAEGALLGLKKRAIAQITPSPLEAFMPHISLAYGVAEGTDKCEMQQRLAETLAGEPIRFTHVSVVSSGKEIPIGDWRVLHSAELK